jgi:DNA topoisomerase IA
VDPLDILPGIHAGEDVNLGFDELTREDFTANAEKALDAIAAGKARRGSLLGGFLREVPAASHGGGRSV